MDHGSISRLCDTQILAARCLCPLLEAMQDVHRFLKLDDVHHSEGTTRIPNADFPSTNTYVIEGLPVIGLHASLNLGQLEAGLSASIVGEIQQVLIGRA
jgi:hypothetical protein